MLGQTLSPYMNTAVGPEPAIPSIIQDMSQGLNFSGQQVTATPVQAMSPPSLGVPIPGTNTSGILATPGLPVATTTTTDYSWLWWVAGGILGLYLLSKA